MHYSDHHVTIPVGRNIRRKRLHENWVIAGHKRWAGNLEMRSCRGYSMIGGTPAPVGGHASWWSPPVKAPRHFDFYGIGKSFLFHAFRVHFLVKQKQTPHRIVVMHVWSVYRAIDTMYFRSTWCVIRGKVSGLPHDRPITGCEFDLWQEHDCRLRMTCPRENVLRKRLYPGCKRKCACPVGLMATR